MSVDILTALKTKSGQVGDLLTVAKKSKSDPGPGTFLASQKFYRVNSEKGSHMAYTTEQIEEIKNKILNAFGRGNLILSLGLTLSI